MSGWAVVTGASSGIGLEFARELAGRGQPVLAVARRRERLAVLAKEARERGGYVEPFVADLKTDEGIAAVLRQCGKLDEIELLVNSAGTASAGDFASACLEEEIGEIRLNVEAVVGLTHAVLKGMVLRGRGAVINVASVVAFQPFPRFAVYAATKAFVLSWSEALAEEVKGTGVRVLALCPGSVATEMEMFAQNEGLLGKLPSLTAKQVVKTGLKAVSNGRVVKVVGGLNRFLPLMGRVLPRQTVRWLMRVSARPPKSMSTESSKS